MTVKEFLTTSPLINISALAKQMYPTNKDAASYLLRKLGDKGRPFTPKDAESALSALQALSMDISKLEL
ncbi:hypothetical protein AY601_4102 [Pedobacter cryoconitis]|uniref:Uncharacterized protein n=1 Tax=Pedobacter cryoconitis TaxID=188932 RepID=A0A127VI23_9SPHI|nr:hypothetical protein AY601_4102 [Pedobacter cryoconitis]